jgi:hypothetical protein
MNPTQAESLLLIIGEDITPTRYTNRALSPKQKLVSFLRFLASDPHYYEVGDSHGKYLLVFTILNSKLGASKSTICQIVRELSAAITKHLWHIIDWPDTQQELEQIREKSFALSVPGIPCIAGAVDGIAI